MTAPSDACPDCGQPWDADRDRACPSCGLSIDDLEAAAWFLAETRSAASRGGASAVETDESPTTWGEHTAAPRTTRDR